MPKQLEAIDTWLTFRWNQLVELRDVMRLARFSLFVVVAAILGLVLNEQGQEIAMGGGERAADFFWYPFATLVCAFQVWFWARRILSVEFPRTEGNPQAPSVMYTPRLLGAVCCAVPLGALMVVWLRHQDSGGTFGLIAVLVATLALFLYVVLKRVEWARKLANMKGAQSNPDSFDGAFGKAFTAGSFLQVLVFGAWGFFWPLSLGAIGAAPVLLLALGAIVPVGSFLVLITRTATFPTVTALMLVGVACSSCDPHYIRDLPEAQAVPHRPTPSEELKRWSTDAPVVNGKKTLVVVATSGGGITAAAWTTVVLDHLRFHDSQFARRLFAISSVSGGSIGTAVFSQSLGCPQALIGNRPQLAKAWDGDLLAPTLATALFRDMPFWFPPASLFASHELRPQDRAAIFERQLEDEAKIGYGKDCGQTLDTSFLHQRSMDAGHWQPILLMNSTHQETGLPVIMSQVSLDSPQNPRPFTPAIDYFAVARGDLRLSTAALNSARFPLVSPAGKMRPEFPTRLDTGRVLDGGYFNNDGAYTLLKLLESLQGELGDVRVIVIQISIDPPLPLDNSRRTSNPKWLADQVAHAPHTSNELLAPLYGFVATRNGNGMAWRHALENWTHLRGNARYFLFRMLVPHAKDGEEPAQPPLGWLLSTHSKQQLEDRTLCLDANFKQWQSLAPELGFGADSLQACGPSETAIVDEGEANVPL